jgi:uncharacterized membrane protein
MDNLPSMRSDPHQALVVSFPNEDEAQKVLETLKQLNAAHDISLSSAAIIRREANGKVDVHETRDFNAKQGAIAGALAGGLIGMLRGNALAGAALGTAAGLGASKVIDLGLPDNFLREVGEGLAPGSSAIVAIVTFENVDQAMQVLDQYSGGKILQSPLSADVARKLSDAVED